MIFLGKLPVFFKEHAEFNHMEVTRDIWTHQKLGLDFILLFWNYPDRCKPVG
jgi:hypothetical protein